MSSIEIIDKLQRNGKDLFEKIDPATYANSMFGMFGGENMNLQIQFDNELANVVIDRFGKNVSIAKVDNEHFKVFVKAVMSPMFMGWLAGFGAGAKVIAPQEAADKYAQHCQSICELYK